MSVSPWLKNTALLEKILWYALRNAILNNTEFMSFAKLKKTRNQIYGTSKKRFCNAKQYFGHSLVTPPPPLLVMNLPESHFVSTPWINNLQNIFLTVRSRLTIDKPVLCYNDNNRTKFQESKSKLYTIILFIIVF